MYEGVKEHLLEKKWMFYRHDKTLLKKKAKHTKQYPQNIDSCGGCGLPSIALHLQRSLNITSHEKDQNPGFRCW